ncbi:ABC transporter permease [Amycolatopsis acidicola]|uniref:ABC transporter permease n=2 Tax=Amycolatopsis acidicola TaxID=2596893 RepID=A0A5N0UZ28_9PSEU|nr:ABC transporter permease [Amycolatopsis acidicola]
MVLVTMVVSLLMALTPGSVAEAILGQNATPENVAALNAKLGLDKPLWQQYLSWLGNALHGDLGTSPLTGQPVSSAIAERAPVTVELAVLSLVIALALALLFAVLGATWPRGRFDRFLNALSSVLLSVPAFIAGPILVYFLSVQTGLFPVLGWAPLDEGLGANLESAFLPALSVALVEIASFHRLLRADLTSTLREEYIDAARARGMSHAYVLFRHALRPSSFSLVTIFGISLGRMIGGTVIVETLFALPGLGQLIVTSIGSRDVIMVQGVVAFTGVVYVAINTVVDLSYGLIDPRVRRAVTA